MSLIIECILVTWTKLCKSQSGFNREFVCIIHHELIHEKNNFKLNILIKYNCTHAIRIKMLIKCNLFF